MPGASGKALLRGVPVGMRRPLLAGQAGGDCPLVQTRGAHAAGIECVPHVTAIAHPKIASVRRPVAFRAADARSRRALARCFADIDFGGCDNARHFPTIILERSTAINMDEVAWLPV